MLQVVLVFIGGGLGAVSRYGVTLLSTRALGAGYPWGTLMVNLAGCFLVGVCFSLATRGEIIGPSGRLFLMTGFLGGLTTFSSYSLESINATRGGAPLLTLINILANNVGGLALTVLGMLSTRLMR
jgi:CrcB protein